MLLREHVDVRKRQHLTLKARKKRTIEHDDPTLARGRDRWRGDAES